MPQPPDQPTPLVLDYQRLEKRRSRVGGILILLAVTILAASIIYEIPYLLSILSSRTEPAERNAFYLRGLVIIAWNANYLTSAFLFRRRNKFAGWIALVMTALMFLSWCIASIREISEGSGESIPRWFIALGSLFMLAVAIGLAALVVALFRTLRDPAFWVEPPK